MTKEELLDEIRRTAAANGGKPLGEKKFATETGIKEGEWKGKLWARWNEAVVEAGLTPNEMREAYSEVELLEKIAQLTCRLNRLPAKMDIRLAIHRGEQLPDPSTLTNTFSGKAQLVARLRKYCEGKAGFEAVVTLCDSYVSRGRNKNDVAAPSGLQNGFVYLKKSAKYYKIGKATAADRRHRELAIQMPERLIPVHEIRTDDTFGIEAYWHNRFADKRRNGEWFALTAADVAAFKKRKFM